VDDIRDELVTALIRAGFGVTDRAERARYHVRGICRVRDGRSHVLLRLLNSETGHHVWAIEHEISGGIGTSTQEHLAISVAAVLQSSLRTAEAHRVRLKPDSELSAEELTMKAWPLAIALGVDTHQRAIESLEQAMDCDPGHALATALAAWCHGQRAVYQFTDDVSDERAQAVALASRALQFGNDSMTLAVLGNAFACAHELAMAEEVTQRALQIDGASAWAWGRSAWLEAYKGRPQTAIERFAIALDLAPQDPMAFNNYAGLGCAYLHLRRYAEAAHWLARAIARHPPASWAHRILCPAYLFCGDRLEAERSLRAIKRLYPGVRASQCAAAAPLPRSDQALVAEGLATMGLTA
jgi:tetratricopeptide (TPR) repeat protein